MSVAPSVRMGDVAPRQMTVSSARTRLLHCRSRWRFVRSTSQNGRPKANRTLRSVRHGVGRLEIAHKLRGQPLRPGSPKAAAVPPGAPDPARLGVAGPQQRPVACRVLVLLDEARRGRLLNRTETLPCSGPETLREFAGRRTDRRRPTRFATDELTLVARVGRPERRTAGTGRSCRVRRPRT